MLLLFVKSLVLLEVYRVMVPGGTCWGSPPPFFPLNANYLHIKQDLFALLYNSNSILLIMFYYVM